LPFTGAEKRSRHVKYRRGRGWKGRDKSHLAPKLLREKKAGPRSRLTSGGVLVVKYGFFRTRTGEESNNIVEEGASASEKSWFRRLGPKRNTRRGDERRHGGANKECR